jgi:hypothetical protein
LLRRSCSNILADFDDHLGKIKTLPIFRARASVVEQVADEGIDPVDLANGNVDQVAGFGVRARKPLEHLDRAGDAGQGIADFVGNVGGQAADASQALGARHGLFHVAQIRQVLEMDDPTDDIARVIGKRRCGKSQARSTPSARTASTSSRNTRPSASTLASTTSSDGMWLASFLPNGRGSGDAKDFAGGIVHAGDGSVERGGHEARRKTTNGVLVKRCQIAHQLLVDGQTLAGLAPLACQADAERADGNQSRQEDHDCERTSSSRVRSQGKTVCPVMGGRTFR